MKKRRSAAQVAATKRMLAARRRTLRNPTKRHAVSKRRYRRNPANPVRRRHYRRNPTVSMFKGGIFKELLSLDGALMIGAAMVAPMTADFVQQTIMPTATGYTKIAVKGAVILGGAWAIQQFLKKPKVALAFGVTGAAVIASDLIQTFQANSTTAVMSGLSVRNANTLAMDPMNARSVVSQSYRPGLGARATPYRVGLGAFRPAFARPF